MCFICITFTLFVTLSPHFLLFYHNDHSVCVLISWTFSYRIAPACFCSFWHQLCPLNKLFRYMCWYSSLIFSGQWLQLLENELAGLGLMSVLKNLLENPLSVQIAFVLLPLSYLLFFYKHSKLTYLWRCNNWQWYCCCDFVLLCWDCKKDYIVLSILLPIFYA